MPETAWCPTCRTSREVMDTYDTDDPHGRGTTYVARPLACGHDAGDGGGTPPRRTPVDDAVLVARLAALQGGAR